MPAKIKRDDLLTELRRLKDELGRVPTSTDMKEDSKYSKTPYQNEFGTWNDALRAAGLEVNSTHNTEYPANNCDWCGSEYKVKPSRKKRSRYCSNECKDKAKSEWTGENNPRPNAGKRVKKECKECGDIFYVYPSLEAQSKYCSKECLGEHNSKNLSGEGSPFYEGGHERYYGPNWRRQRRKRLDMDNHKCQSCGITQKESREKWGKGLAIHHKIPIKTFESYEKANKINNLVTLCVSCHRKIEARLKADSS